MAVIANNSAQIIHLKKPILLVIFVKRVLFYVGKIVLEKYFVAKVSIIKIALFSIVLIFAKKSSTFFRLNQIYNVFPLIRKVLTVSFFV